MTDNILSGYLTDSATSNWLTHVHRELPHARLDGFDSSLEQFPPKGWWPPNVTLEYLDALKPIPQELHGKYDIVHVRLFLFVIQNGDPRPLLDNAMHMLSKYSIPGLPLVTIPYRSNMLCGVVDS